MKKYGREEGRGETRRLRRNRVKQRCRLRQAIYEYRTNGKQARNYYSKYTKSQLRCGKKYMRE